MYVFVWFVQTKPFFMMCAVKGNVFVWCVQSEGLCMCVCVVCTDRRTYFHDVFDGKPDSVYVYVFLWGVQQENLF